MEHQLPELIIEGTPFLVDVNNEILIQSGNEQNRIGFDQMVYQNNHYELEYNKVSKNEHLPWDEATDRIQVSIPEMVTLDRVGMARKFSVDVNHINGMSDLYLRNGMEALTDRIKGILPRIKIGEEYYIIDWAAMKLSSEIDPSKKIDLSKLKMDEHQTKYSCYFNTKERCVVDLNPKSEYSPNVFLLMIPCDVYLDPVGVARRAGKDDTFYLQSYPIQKNLKAVLEPLDKQMIKRKLGERISSKKRNWKRM